MPFRLVTIGTSLGGFAALKTILGGLPVDFPAAVAVVQHRSAEDPGGLASALAVHAALPVIEVEDKDEIRAGHVYLSPPNYHLLVEHDHFVLSTDSPVMLARPSIDVLFESAAEAFREEVIGVLLTGMSRDGSAGLAKIKECGGCVVVQDPQTAEGQTMPKAAISSVAVDRILPLADIAAFLAELCATQRSEV